MPQHMLAGDEKAQCGQIGHQVDYLGAGGGGEEIVGKKAHEHEGQQAARARAEQSVIKADGRAKRRAQQHFAPRERVGALGLPQIFAEEGVHKHRHHNHQHGRFHILHRHIGHQLRTGERSGKGQHAGGQQHFPRQLQAAGKLAGGGEGAGERSRLVGAQHGGYGRGRRQHAEQRGQLQQPAAANGRIHQPGQKAGDEQQDKGKFHGFLR